MRVRMIRCIEEEPEPPSDPEEFEAWCESGNSGRPVQNHVGDEGIVLWANTDERVSVLFDDGDERLLWPKEIEPVEIKAE